MFAAKLPFCYRGDEKVKEGGFGDFNLELKYVTFRLPECRRLFWQKDKGVDKPIQKQESLWAFAVPQCMLAEADVAEIWHATLRRLHACIWLFQLGVTGGIFKTRWPLI